MTKESAGLTPIEADTLIMLCARFLEQHEYRRLLFERAMLAGTRAEQELLWTEYRSIFGANGGIDAAIDRIAALPATSDAAKHIKLAVLCQRWDPALARSVAADLGGQAEFLRTTGRLIPEPGSEDDYEDEDG